MKKTVDFKEIFKEKENGEYKAKYHMSINGVTIASGGTVNKHSYFRGFKFEDLLNSDKINVEIKNGFLRVLSIGEETPFRFTQEVIEELGLVWEEYVSPNPKTPKDKYGRAKSASGKRLLGWHHDYYEDGVHHLTIEEDAGTRQVFHGRIRSLEEFKLIMELVS